MALPEHFERLSEHLEYVWTGAIFLPGRHTIFRRKMIFGRWRPVAFFSAGPYEVRTTLVDVLWSDGQRRRSPPEDHPWQQAVRPFERLVEMATRRGELVVDPFLGSGTAGLACLVSGRQFLGVDLDSGAVSLAAAADRGTRRASVVVARYRAVPPGAYPSSDAVVTHGGALAWHHVDVKEDHLRRLVRNPLAGVTELIWNALDADASEVRVSFSEGALRRHRGCSGH